VNDRKRLVTLGYPPTSAAVTCGSRNSGRGSRRGERVGGAEENATRDDADNREQLRYFGHAKPLQVLPPCRSSEDE
jgi:hypothetical protein